MHWGWGGRLPGNLDWGKPSRRKVGKIGIPEYVISEDHGLEQSTRAYTGAKVLQGSILTNVEVMSVCIQSLYLYGKVLSNFFSPVHILWNYVNGFGNTALTFLWVFSDIMIGLWEQNPILSQNICMTVTELSSDPVFDQLGRVWQFPCSEHLLCTRLLALPCTHVLTDKGHTAASAPWRASFMQKVKWWVKPRAVGDRDLFGTLVPKCHSWADLESSFHFVAKPPK